MYSKTVWRNDKTPLNESNMNNIENGICERIDEDERIEKKLDEAIAYIQEVDEQKTTPDNVDASISTHNADEEAHPHILDLLNDRYTKSETDSNITKAISDIIGAAPSNLDSLEELINYINTHETEATATFKDLIKRLDDHIDAAYLHIPEETIKMWTAHTENNEIHTSVEEKEILNSHLLDKDIHITDIDRANWNGKAEGIHSHTIDEVFTGIVRDDGSEETLNEKLTSLSDTLSAHNHDEVYSKLDHNHDDAYASITHNHDDAYASITHEHNDTYALIAHNHDDMYAKLDHNHDGVYATTEEVNSAIAAALDSLKGQDGDGVDTIAEVVALVESYKESTDASIADMVSKVIDSAQSMNGSLSLPKVVVDTIELRGGISGEEYIHVNSPTKFKAATTFEGRAYAQEAYVEVTNPDGTHPSPIEYERVYSPSNPQPPMCGHAGLGSTVPNPNVWFRLLSFKTTHTFSTNGLTLLYRDIYDGGINSNIGLLIIKARTSETGVWEDGSQLDFMPIVDNDAVNANSFMITHNSSTDLVTLWCQLKDAWQSIVVTQISKDFRRPGESPDITYYTSDEVTTGDNVVTTLPDEVHTFRENRFYTQEYKPTPADIGAVSKSGDTINGDLIVKGNQCVVPRILGKQGSNGYVKIARFTVEDRYSNAPIMIEVTRRDCQLSTRLFIQFANADNLTPGLSYFYATGGTRINAYMSQDTSNKSVWYLIINRGEPYDDAAVLDYRQGAHNCIKVEWLDEHLSSLPSSNYIQAKIWEANLGGGNTRMHFRGGGIGWVDPCRRRPTILDLSNPTTGAKSLTLNLQYLMDSGYTYLDFMIKTTDNEIIHSMCDINKAKTYNSNSKMFMIAGEPQYLRGFFPTIVQFTIEKIVNVTQISIFGVML